MANFGEIPKQGGETEAQRKLREANAEEARLAKERHEQIMASRAQRGRQGGGGEMRV